MIDNNVPSNVFEVNNLANGDGFVYSGKTSLVDNAAGGKTITTGNNCLSTFLVGSIVPGRNIRLDIPTESDPNIFLDAKFFDFQPYSPAVSGFCTLGKTQDTSGDMSYYFRSLINDGSNTDTAWTIIEADDESFYIGFNGLTYYKQTDSSGNVSYSRSVVATNPNSLILKTHQFDIANTHAYMPSLYTHKNVDEYGNTTFFLNKIIAGPGLTIKDDADTLQLNFDYTKARPTPCCNSEYSGIDIYDPVSVSSSSITKITCSDTADVYLMGYDFKNHVTLSTYQCDGGFCNWSLDAYTFAVTSAPSDFNSSSSSSLSSNSSPSSLSSLSSQSENGKAIVEIKNIYTQDDPNSPFIPNGIYTLEYVSNNQWETPANPLDVNAPYISIQYIETETGWIWRSVYGCGFRRGCGNGCSPNNCQVVDNILSGTLNFQKDNINAYFSKPESIFSFNSTSYKCGSPLFVRGMVVKYIDGGDFAWENNSSSSYSSASSVSSLSSPSSNSSQSGTSQSSNSKSSHSSSSSSSSSYMELNAPYFVRSGWYYRLKAEQTVDGYFMWNLRVMKYSTYYRDCLDDESSDYYHPFDRDYDQQEKKVVRQDSELLVLTHTTSGAFDLFTRDIPLQPNGKFVFNEELTNDWVAQTTPPAYESSDNTRIEFNVAELFLDGPHHTHNINTYAMVSKAWTDCGPYIESSSSSLSDSESMGPLVSSSSNSSDSSTSSSSSSLSSNSLSSLSSNSSSSSSSSSISSLSTQSGSQSSLSSQT